ncbi:hypothetical protein [uncultured Dysosmobacter sp.]|uniref:hypothetical protein n=1 Tax=uncultured Dysosmobacter sp. TaxID=2591384 RepID=UPI00262C8BF1|nr:hypothetical protein [uncultured Dysosmobacter sp.]
MAKWGKWLPKWDRKRKIIRNLLCIVLALFLMSWATEFPSLTKAGLIRRAERQYLMAGDSQVLLETDSIGGGCELYLWNQGDVLQVYYDRTLMGLWLDDVRLYDEEVGAFAGIDLAAGKQDGYYPIHLFVFGDLPDATSAEMDITLSYTSNQMVSTCTARGTRAAENCWRFDLTRQHGDADTSQQARWEREIFAGSQKERYSGVLRMYGENEALLETRDIEQFRRTTMRWL